MIATVKPFGVSSKQGVASRTARKLTVRCHASASSVRPDVLRQQATLVSAVAAAWKQHQANMTAQQPANPQELKQLMSRGQSMMAVVLPFAAMTVAGGRSETAELLLMLAKVMDIYMLVLTFRILMTWFRNINWRNEPFNTLRTFTDPFLNLFRGVIPPIGGIDLSPMLGFLLMNFAIKQLKVAALSM